ncbi:MAG: hypothetical protein AAF843_03135 [Bacteroidota bacterium]
MYIPFDDMSPQSRVWIYQSNRELSSEEQLTVGRLVQSFLDQWAAHNQALKSSFSFFYGHFLVISVDESFHQASGCSIDASVHLLKQIEEQLDISFFDRTKVAFLKDEAVFLEPISEIKSNIVEGKISDQTLTFNNLVQYKEELTTDWIVPAAESWLKRYFHKVGQH